jgi:plastocyanin
MGDAARTGPRALHTPALLILTTAALLAACTTAGPTGSSPTAGASTATGSPPAAGTAVTATETEYMIALSTTTFTAGTYTVTVHNQGKQPHNLNVKGPGIAGQTSPTVSPGSAQLTVTMQTGSYELWCSVDGHKDLGMDVTIRVG